MNALSADMQPDLKKNFYFILAIELLFVILLWKSTTFTILFWILICGSFFLYLYPEIGFAIPYLLNILFYLLFDYVKVSIPIPAYLSYILIISLSTAIYLIRNKEERKFEINTLFWISIIIGAILIVGVLYSSDKTYGMKKVFFYFTYNMPVLMTAMLLKNDHKSIERLLLMIIFIGVLVTFISYKVASANIFFQFVRFRLSENIGPLFLARTLGIASVSALFFIVRYQNIFLKAIFILLLGGLISPIIWSASRAPVIGLMLTLLLFYLLQPSQSIFRKIGVTSIGLIVGIIYFLQSASQVAVRMATPLEAEASAAFRFLAWFKAIQDFSASPLLGIGTGSFILKTPYIPLVYPHNLILELSCENGILGLIVIIVFLFLAIKLGLKNIYYYFRENKSALTQLNITIVCIFAFSLWNAMFSGDIYANAIVWWPIGLIWALAPPTKK